MSESEGPLRDGRLTFAVAEEEERPNRTPRNATNHTMPTSFFARIILSSRRKKERHRASLRHGARDAALAGRSFRTCAKRVTQAGTEGGVSGRGHRAGANRCSSVLPDCCSS